MGTLIVIDAFLSDYWGCLLVIDVYNAVESFWKSRPPSFWKQTAKKARANGNTSHDQGWQKTFINRLKKTLDFNFQLLFPYDNLLILAGGK